MQVKCKKDDDLKAERSTFKWDKVKWKSAMNEEYKYPLNNQSWEIVGLPQTMKVVQNKWVFEIKEAENSKEHR
jgi:hypothetical protein